MFIWATMNSLLYSGWPYLLPVYFSRPVFFGIVSMNIAQYFAWTSKYGFYWILLWMLSFIVCCLSIFLCPICILYSKWYIICLCGGAARSRGGGTSLVRRIAYLPYLLVGNVLMKQKKNNNTTFSIINAKGTRQQNASKCNTHVGASRGRK